MTTRHPLTRLTAIVLVACLMAVFTLPAHAARIDTVDADSMFAKHFKVVVKHEQDEVRVTVTVPKRMDGHDFRSLTMYSNEKVRARSNGTELEFVIEKEHYEQAFVTAGYLAPSRDDGAFWAFQLDISSLAGALK